MAKYVVPPKGENVVLVKCSRCKTLYAPDLNVHPHGWDNRFEFCPTCKYDGNSWSDMIPLWKYNLIRWIRGFGKEKP